MADDVAYIFLDTNALLHFRRPDSIDWQKLAGARSIRLIVTPIVLSELDDQKVTNRSRKGRDRAQGVANWLASFIEHTNPVEVRPGTTLEFVRHSPLIDFAKHRLRSHIYDDELIASAIEFQAERGCNVSIFTNDGSLRAKLPAHSIKAITPLPELALPQEQTEAEKKAAAIEDELAEIKTRIPTLTLQFEDGGDETDIIMLTEWAMDKKAGPIESGLLMDADRNRRYVLKHQQWKQGAARSCIFRVFLSNVGTAAAHNIQIEITFPEGVKAAKLSEEPVAPRIIDMPDVQFDPPSEEEPVYADDGTQITFEIESLVQSRTFKSAVIFLRFPTPTSVESFKAPFKISYIEAPKPIRGELSFLKPGE